RINGAVAVVLALVGPPVGGAGGRQIELRNSMASQIPEPHRPFSGDRRRESGREHEKGESGLAHDTPWAHARGAPPGSSAINEPNANIGSGEDATLWRICLPPPLPILYPRPACVTIPHQAP